MNYKTLYTGLIVVIFSIVIFGFNLSETTVPKNKKINEQYSFKNLIVKYSLNSKNENGPKLYINGNYGMFGPNERSIKKSTVLSANSLIDLLQECTDIKTEDYESVWIKSMFGEEGDISIMSKDNNLSAEQLSLLRTADIGSFFDVVVNYHEKNPHCGAMRHERMNISLTVVPEEEAQFQDGQKALMAYFERNKELIKASQGLDDFSSVRVKFTISENGQAEQVEVSRESEYPEIDALIYKLVNDMPAWKPAKAENGSFVKQDFQLLYGRPGC